MIHDFRKSLEISHSAEDLPLWEQCYRQAFPGFVAMHSHRKNGEWQKAGIDRSIILESSQQVLVDEKYRTKPYDDILLEYISRDTDNSPGWVCKSLRCNYIAYAVGPLGRCYLMPALQLQSSWNKNGKLWLRRFGTKVAKNGRYNTLNVAVPANEVIKSLVDAMILTFTPDTEDLGF